MLFFASAGAGSAYLAEAWLGVPAERRSQESVATPLSAEAAATG